MPGHWNFEGWEEHKAFWDNYDAKQAALRFKSGGKPGQFWHPKYKKWKYLVDCAPFEGVDPETGYITFYSCRTWPCKDGHAYDKERYKKICEALGVRSLTGYYDEHNCFHYWK